MLKIKYIGETKLPLGLAINTIPAVTKDEIYEVVLDNKESNVYVFIDDYGMKKVMNKSNFEKVE